MRFTNTQDRYGAVAIALHWLGAITIAIMLGTGLMMALASDRAAYVPWVKLHSSIGLIVWLILAARVAWHFVDRAPAKLSDHRALNRLAATVHIGLLVAIGLQLVTGPVDVWSGGFPLNVFDWFVVPNPIGATLKAQHEAIGDFHAYVGLTIACLLVLHLAGVAKHVFYDRDGTLRRMLGRSG